MATVALLLGLLIAPASAAPLTVDFTCDPSCSVQPGTTVTFTATSNAAKPTYYWDLNNDGTFGDATGVTTSMSFDQPGTYPIGVEVVDDATKTQTTTTHSVTVTSGPGLTVSVDGPGTVTSTPSGIDCPGTCSATYAPGTKVTLTATPTSGDTLGAWEDDCSGRDKCSVDMDADHSVKATFVFDDRTDFTSLRSFGEAFADGGPSGTVDVTPTALGSNKPPRPKLTVPGKVRAGELVTLDASQSTDPDGKVVGFRWDLNGDGVYDDGFGSKVRFPFWRAGHDPVSVEVLDNSGRTVPLTKRVTVRRGRPLPVQRTLASLSRRALSGSFNSGLDGWHDLGGAFVPRTRSWVPMSQVLDSNGRLGGNYADGIRIPVGSHGRGWVTSFRPPRPRPTGLSEDATADAATGVLLSPPFRVTRRYLEYLLGGNGTQAPGAESVEILVRAGHGFTPRKTLTRYVTGDQETMTPVALDLKRLQGKTVAVGVIDRASTGHVNVDQMSLAKTPTLAPGVLIPATASPYYEQSPSDREHLPAPAPIYGFADYHSHPDATQAFGALHGIHTYMGDPGADVSLYDRNAGAFLHDQYADDDYHFGGPLAAFIVNVLEQRRTSDDMAGALGSLASYPFHPLRGGNCVGGCHEFHATSIGPAHEQMNIFEIHRAWEGGLRLLSSLAVNSATIDYGMGAPYPGTADLGGPTESSPGVSANHGTVTPDRDVIEAQVAAMRQLADANSSWMEIAYDPQQVYDIMRAGKLAIILGTEIDTTGDLGFPTAAAEVDWLWHLGVRQVTPIHCCDSRIGGAAVFQDLYNSANDFLHRPTRDVTSIEAGNDIRDQGLGTWPKPDFTGNPQVGYFIRTRGGCPHSTDRGTCIRWRFDSPRGDGTATYPRGQQSIVDVDGNCIAVFPGCLAHPALFHTDVPAYDDVVGGMENSQGLTSYGRQYISALMSRGMLIDMEHMSDQTISDVIDPGTTPGHTPGPVWGENAGCSPFASYNDPHTLCWQHAYPLMSSHTSYRAQSLRPGETTFKGFLSREFERTPEQIEYIHRSGGVVGPVLLQDAVDTISTRVPSATGPTWQVVTGHDRGISSAPPNNCAGSSESWAQAYLYGVQKMGGSGVGIGSDMLLVGGPRPRFGARSPDNGRPYACGDSIEAAHPSDEEAANRGQYNRGAQLHPISYAAPTQPLHGTDGTLRIEQDPAGITRNFNTQGMLTYGTLPDLLQDVHDVGVTYNDLFPLSQSAQAYVDMWAKTYALAGCYRGGSAGYAHCSDDESPASLDYASVCKNTCPNDPGRGLQLAPNGERFTFRSPS